MYVAQLHAKTSTRLAAVDAGAPPSVAAHVLTRGGVGLIVVCGNDGRAVGVLSKSDLIRHLAQPAVDATVASLMSRSMLSCTPDDDLHVVCQTMTDKGLQNMPVLDAHSVPLGVLHVRDAMQALLEQEELQERRLADYIAGVGYR